MRKSFLYLMTGFIASLITAPVLAQPSETEMADIMRSNGKIYVVVAVLVTILTGLILYLISLDRRIRRMERNAD